MCSALPVLLLLCMLSRRMENFGKSSLYTRRREVFNFAVTLLDIDTMNHWRSGATPKSSLLLADSPTLPPHYEFALRQAPGTTPLKDPVRGVPICELGTCCWDTGNPVCRGYPLAFLATWALALRCVLILLIALSLRPAPSPVQTPELYHHRITVAQTYELRWKNISWKERRGNSSMCFWP